MSGEKPTIPAPKGYDAPSLADEVRAELARLRTERDQYRMKWEAQRMMLENCKRQLKVTRGYLAEARRDQTDES